MNNYKCEKYIQEGLNSAIVGGFRAAGKLTGNLMRNPKMYAKRAGAAGAGFVGSTAAWNYGQKILNPISNIPGLGSLKDAEYDKDQIQAKLDAAQKAQEEIAQRLQNNPAATNLVTPTMKAWGKTALGVGAAGAGAAALGAGAHAVRNIMQRRQWIKGGCSNIVDETQKKQCMLHVRNTKVKELNKKMQLCRDENCRESIRNSIQNVMSHKIGE